jgi:diacylglycerol kinase family enzyme
LPNARIEQTEYAGHAIEIVQNGIKEGIRYILVVGGDGTHHEVINGILQQKQVPSTDILYALLPVGTGNDWIKTHGIPKRFSDWLSVFKAGKIVGQNAGLLTYFWEGQARVRYFANVAGLAYDGYVVRYTEQKAPRFSGKIYYLWVVLRCLFQYSLQSAVLRFGGQEVKDRFYTINAGIGRYSGGGMQLVPQADPRGDALALTYAGPISKLGIVLNTYRFYQGSIGGHPKVTTTTAQRIEVATADDGPLLLEADGEFLGETPVTIELVPDALRFIAP